MDITPKQKRLARLKSGRLVLLERLYGLAIENILNYSGNWIVVLNASFDCGVIGKQLQAAFLAQPGFKRVEMFFSGVPFSFVEFATNQNALACFSELDGIYSPSVQKDLLLEMVSLTPEFPQRPLLDPGLIQRAVPGLELSPNFLNVHEESLILDAINQDPTEWQLLRKRKVKHFGFRFDYDKRAVDRAEDNEMPLWAKELMCKIQTDNQTIQIDQLTINNYEPGGAISPHSDTHSSFVSPLVIVSLGGGVVMDFRSRMRDNSSEWITHSVLIPERSLLLMDGDSRYGWEHIIRPRKMDLIDGLVVPRLTRISLTFRKLREADNPCSCSFKHLCA
jgi:alkylated DNA repair dioxygenase AlkB